MNRSIIRRSLVCALLALSAGLVSATPQIARAQTAPGVTFTILHYFGSSASDAIYPYGALVQGVDGDFYGVGASDDGSHTGAVYKTTSSGTESVLYNASTYYSGPEPDLALGSDGNFYGLTNSLIDSGTSLFQITPLGVIASLYEIGSATQSVFPGVVIGPDGNFYGCFDSFPTFGLFKMTPSGEFTTYYVCQSGDWITSLPIFDANGNLYAATAGDNQTLAGSIIKIDPSGAAETLYTFPNVLTSGDVHAGLTLGSDGNLYGLSEKGGTYNGGMAFKLTPSGTFSTLYSFPTSTVNSSRPTAAPEDAMIQGTDGNFYGVTPFGGPYANGTVFQLTPSGALTTLYSFSTQDSVGNNTGGAIPHASLVEGKDGALYGSTLNGGINGGVGNDGFGTLYKLTVPSLTASVATPIPTVTRFDFNKDGHADLFWYNSLTGQVATWDMNGDAVLAFNSAFQQVDPSTGWRPVATPDVNGDSYPDVVWWNKNTGEMSIWTLQNTTVLSYGADFATLANTDWKPVAAADVTGTTWELVFQNTTTGAISAWDMNGQTITSYQGTLASLGPGSDWRVVGAPDIDGDGHSDLLFRNTATGEISYWSTNLNAQAVIAYHSDIAQVTDTDWVLEGAEDVNGDGHPDFIWWNSATGEVAHWLLDGPTVTSYGASFATEPDTHWQPTAIR